MPFPNRITPNPSLIYGGNTPAFMAPPTGVFEPVPGKLRYAPELDLNTLTVRMCKSTDSGVTWAEVDGANAPAIPADGSGGGGFVQVYEFINACMDPVTKIIYTCYWDPASFNIALAPFNANPASPNFDKWLPRIISTLSYLPTAANQFFNSGSFVTAFRKTDKSVWVWFYGGGADANDVATVWGAKCLVTAAGTGTWDVALTRMAGTLHDGIEYAQGGGGVDNNGNIHYWISRHYSGFGASGHTTQHPDGLGNMIVDGLFLDLPGAGYLASTTLPLTVHVSGLPDFHSTATVAVDGGGVVAIVIPPGLIGATYLAVSPAPTVSFGTSPANSDMLHYALHPDNSIAGPQFVNHNAIQHIFSSAFNCTPDNVLLSSYQAGPNVGTVRHVVRGAAGDAPAWEDTTPAQIQEPNFSARIDVVHSANGDDLIVFGLRAGGVSNYFYSASKGIGKAFDAPVLIGSFDNSGADFANRSLVAGIFDALGITFAFGPGGVAFGAIGMGYFELALPAPALQQIKITFWGKLRYLLAGDVEGGSAAVQCVVGYPTEARAIAGRRGLAIELIPDPRAELQDRLRYPCGPNTNVMAPEFLLGNQCADDTPEGYEDEPFTFFSPAITVPAGQTVYGTAVLIPGTEDVVLRRLRALITWTGEDPDGSPTFSLRLPNGYSMTGGDLIPLGGITSSTPDFPGLFQWMTIFPTIVVKAGDRIILDMGDLFPGGGLASITTVFEFDAVKRRKL